ncbi:MAG: hypothetical protein ABEK59_00875 [Halobacteria archaeon]
MVENNEKVNTEVIDTEPGEREINLDIKQAISEGFEGAAKPNTLKIGVIIWIINVLSFLFIPLQNETRSQLSDTSTIADPVVALLNIRVVENVVVEGVITAFLSLLVIFVNIALIRILVSERSEGIPGKFWKRRAFGAWINLFVGGIVFGLILGLGFLALLIPGIFLLLSLYLWMIYVAVDDENFVSAFGSSWETAKGHRWSLLGMFAALTVGQFIINAVGLGFSRLVAIASPVVGGVVFTAFVAFTALFTFSVYASSYRQLD